MNIVFCADGTWNDPTDRTNVYKLFAALEGGPEVEHPRALEVGPYTSKASPDQRSIYVEGVGAHGTMNELLSGATGVGLHARVIDGYILISREYAPGDKIFIFGFSRGAYTARALAGLIAGAGLMDRAHASGPGARIHADRLWWDVKHQGMRAAGAAAGVDADVECVGVWDTVGALGIPLFNGVGLVDKVERELFDFADTSLSPRVKHGRHAMAIDSMRKDFEPTPWDARDATVKQVWFAGVHSDVGGGYAQSGLSDVALRWMIEETEPLGVRFVAGWATALAPDPLADRHDSSAGPIWKVRGLTPRTIAPTAHVHPSVTARFKGRPDYRPESLRNHPQFSGFYGAGAPAEALSADAGKDPRWTIGVGESVTLGVDAARLWNAARLHVSPNEQYHVDAKGEWKDWHTTTTADGYEKGFLGALAWSRRVPAAPWFRLVAAIDDDPHLETETPSVAQILLQETHKRDAASQLVPVGASGDVHVSQSGFLYFFANDAAVAYGNNQGSITLTITRVR